MRLNLPVTDTEYALKEGTTIVSKTDLNGRISYVNDGFIEASGYSEEELIGKPHNMLRHPDMPAEVFADMWQTIGARQAWTGMVKNRRKNGDYYWVLANVTPLSKKPPTIGFLSVRTKPTRAQIQEADRIYRLFKEGRARGLHFYQGMLMREDLFGRLATIRRIPVEQRIMLTAIAAALMTAALGGLGWWQTTPAAQALGVQHWMPMALATVGGIGALLLVLFGWFISSTILKPLDRATEVAHAIAWGNLGLEFEMTEFDETAPLMRALNQMKANLMAVLTDADNQVKRIDTIAQTITQAGNQLAAATASDGASSTEQLAAATSQLQRQTSKLGQIMSVFKLDQN